MANPVRRMTPKHDAIIRWLIANPALKRRHCAEAFNVSEPWLATLVNSDMFQAALDEHRENINAEFSETIGMKAAYAAELSLDKTISLLKTGATEKFVEVARDSLLSIFGFKGVQVTKDKAHVDVHGDVFFSITGEDLEAARERKRDRDFNLQVING